MKMTMNEFAFLCGRYNLEPSLVLENNNILECLINIRDTRDQNVENGYRNALVLTLETEF